MINKFYVVVVVIMLFLLIIGTIFMGYAYMRGWWRFSYEDVQISDFSICTGVDPLTMKPQGRTYVITEDIDTINLCGYLTATIPAELGYYIYSKSGESPIFDVTAYDVEPGYFYQEILLPKENRIGTYRVDVYFNREIIASIEFEILGSQ